MYTVHGKDFMGGWACERHAGRHCINVVGLLWEVAAVIAMGGRRRALPPNPPWYLTPVNGGVNILLQIYEDDRCVGATIPKNQRRAGAASSPNPLPPFFSKRFL